jgi:hypothetical protein
VNAAYRALEVGTPLLEITIGGAAHLACVDTLKTVRSGHMATALTTARERLAIGLAYFATAGLEVAQVDPGWEEAVRAAVAASAPAEQAAAST